ncbi:hypothetical protein KN825_15925, partial [Weizmannia coagulans]|nr:hypothetical protein [Heyndrickxia coagulans]
DLLKSKDEVFGRFKEWKTMVEKRTGKQVKTLRIDNGLEFCNAQFDNFCKKEGIVRHHTVRHTTTKWSCRTYEPNTHAACLMHAT